MQCLKRITKVGTNVINFFWRTLSLRTFLFTLNNLFERIINKRDLYTWMQLQRRSLFTKTPSSDVKIIEIATDIATSTFNDGDFTLLDFTIATGVRIDAEAYRYCENQDAQLFAQRRGASSWRTRTYKINRQNTQILLWLCRRVYAW